VLPSITTNFVFSAHGTCFGRTDHPQVFKYMILKLKVK